MNQSVREMIKVDNYKDRFIEIDEDGTEWRKVKKYKVEFISYSGEVVSKTVEAVDVTMAIATVRGSRNDFTHVDSVFPLD